MGRFQILDTYGMYDRFAAVYDAIYSFKNYAEESEKLTGLIRSHCPEAKTLLDVACGTAPHIGFLKNEFQCVGVDLSEQAINIARAKYPDVEFSVGDMKSFDLGRQFDAVTCLFSAIGYMHSMEDLGAAAANLMRHVAPGGVLIVEPWISPEKFKDGMYHVMTAETPDMKIARAHTSRREGILSVMDFHFLVAAKDGTEHFQEEHRLAMFSHDQYLEAFSTPGTQVSFEPEGLTGRGLYIANRVGL